MSAPKQEGLVLTGWEDSAVSCRYCDERVLGIHICGPGLLHLLVDHINTHPESVDKLRDALLGALRKK